MKNQPLENRKFYEQFYEQQDKAEKINVLQDVSKRIHQVIAADEAQRSSEQDSLVKQSLEPTLTLQQYLAANKSIMDLGLNHNQKKKLMNKIRDDDEKLSQGLGLRRANVVTKSKE